MSNEAILVFRPDEIGGYDVLPVEPHELEGYMGDGWMYLGSLHDYFKIIH
jgi:hypothetical protein